MRRRTERAEQDKLRAAANLAGQLNPAKHLAKKKAKGSRVPTARTAVSAKHIERLVERVESCIESGEWGDRKPDLLVGVFCFAHQQIYGVSCVSELKRYFYTAYQGAKRLQEQEFGNDFEATVLFIRWVWTREREREDWRRNNSRHGKRVKWRDVFIERALVTEWRLDRARAKGIK